MNVAEHRNADSGLKIRDRNRAIEHDVAVVEGIRENHRIGVHWRDEVGARREVLTGGEAGCKQGKEKSDDSCRKLWMSYQPSGSGMDSSIPDIG